MRKTTYKPLGPQESFIVPLLAKEVESALAEISLSLLRSSNCNNSKKLVLDCGCGNQPFKNDTIRHGFEYESLDVSQNEGNSIDYLCALDAPLEIFSSIVAKTYSLVIATEVLEHISDWHSAFANIASCMKPGGYALLTAPFFYPLHEEPHDYWRPTAHQFARASRNAGLEVHSIKKLGNAVDVIGTTLAAATISYSHGSGISAKIINRLLLRFQKAILDLMVRHRDRFGSSCETIYLSNAVVLRKV